MSVKIVFVCHDTNSINFVFKNNIDFNIIFVGNKELSEDIKNDNRIIIAKNYKNNIEEHNELLTFTAWYLISKNNLFSEYDYICILEWDIEIYNHNFINNLESITNEKKYDCISFFKDNYCFHYDINIDIFNCFLKNINIDPNYFNSKTDWYSTTNHCLNRNLLNTFVNIYYPLVLKFKLLDYRFISWYHERIFASYILYNKKNVYHLNGYIKHFQSNSHSSFIRNPKIPDSLMNIYINNYNCNFLNNFIENYNMFLNLNINFKIKVGSYLCSGLCYSYFEGVYEKQKLLFNSVKICKNALLIGNYMGHIAYIMLLSNPNISITCIDTEENRLHINLLEKYFNIKITLLISNNQEDIINLLSEFNHSFDFIHVSQQYPIREYLNKYINICIENTELQNLTFIIDDYNVYSDELIEKIKYDNPHCIINDKVLVNGFNTNNTTKKFEIIINKKYLLIYDDDTNNFKSYIDSLILSVKKFDKSFEIIIFNKKDIDDNFMNNNKYILEQPKGGGYWLWKPYIINKTLLKIKDNDILFYIDSKYYFTDNFKELLKPLSIYDLLIWRNKPNEESYYLKNWCKMDIINKYNIYNDVFTNNIEICWAGAIVIRKNDKNINIFGEWLNMCSSNDITDFPSTIPNSPDFIDHRHDQSLLSILLFKYKINMYTFERRFLQNVRNPY